MYFLIFQPEDMLKFKLSLYILINVMLIITNCNWGNVFLAVEINTGFPLPNCFC